MEKKRKEIHILPSIVYNLKKSLYYSEIYVKK